MRALLIYLVIGFLLVPLPAMSTTPDIASVIQDATKQAGSKNYKEAVRILSAAIATVPNNADLYAFRGMSLLYDGQDDSALRDFETALKLDQSLFVAWGGRGTVFLRKKQYMQAITSFDRSLSLSRRSPEIFAYRARAYLEIGSPDQALKDINEAIKIAPRSAEFLARRGEIYSRMNNRDQAMADLRASLHIDPKNELAVSESEKLQFSSDNTLDLCHEEDLRMIVNAARFLGPDGDESIAADVWSTHFKKPPEDISDGELEIFSGAVDACLKTGSTQFTEEQKKETTAAVAVLSRDVAQRRNKKIAANRATTTMSEADREQRQAIIAYVVFDALTFCQKYELEFSSAEGEYIRKTLRERFSRSLTDQQRDAAYKASRPVTAGYIDPLEYVNADAKAQACGELRSSLLPQVGIKMEKKDDTSERPF